MASNNSISYRMRWRFGIWLFLLSAVCSPLSAESPLVPVDVQYNLMLKALDFDRNLETRCGDDIVIAVLYQHRYRSSVVIKDDAENIARVSSITSIGSLPLKVVAIDVENPDWKQEAHDRKVDVLMLAPIRALDIAEITEFSRSHGTLTTTFEPELVQKGISLGISIRDNRPRFSINLAAAKAEGADFSSQLLNLADVSE